MPPMRSLFLGLFLVLLVAALTPAQSTRPVSKAQFDGWMKELSNWGRWGKDDQLGALNLITPAKRKEAAAEVKEGYSVSLARDAETEKAADNPTPFVHTMVRTGLDSDDYAADVYQVDFHGLAHTHLDALGHFFYQGRMYNGYSKNEVTRVGAARNSILNMKSGIVTRGILIDIPKLKGLEYLEPGTAIYPEDLDAWEKKTGIRVSSGDAIFIRTGRWARRKVKGPWPVSEGLAGLHASSGKWLHDRNVAILGSDAASDVNPSQVEGVPGTPVHLIALVALGVPIFDNCDLEAIGQAAVRRNRYTFMLTAAPLAVPGGTGSPLNPIATF
jgi:kynurenine formamidase